MFVPEPSRPKARSGPGATRSSGVQDRRDAEQGVQQMRQIPNVQASAARVPARHPCTIAVETVYITPARGVSTTTGTKACHGRCPQQDSSHRGGPSAQPVTKPSTE